MRLVICPLLAAQALTLRKHYDHYFFIFAFANYNYYHVGIIAREAPLMRSY